MAAKRGLLSLGLDKVVFLKSTEDFKVHKIETGHMHKELLQITSGLQEKDSVAANGQYLIDSESFVKQANPKKPEGSFASHSLAFRRLKNYRRLRKCRG